MPDVRHDESRRTRDRCDRGGRPERRQARETAELAGASYAVVDVSQPDDVKRLVATAVERHGKLTAA
ncbi:MAG: SDR family oxidoreductase [Actinomycetota bacterium]|nr:SDR family oxidoreductase [Actinomycetota bacterium]